MNAIAPRGWCPTLEAPMESGDGWLVRLRPPRGMVSAKAARALADTAAAFGNGTVELTQRAALQVRGLRPATVAPFAAAMAAAGLAAPEGAPSCAILRAPLGGDGALADAIEAAMARVAGLPPKFCIAIDVDGAEDGADSGAGDGALPLGDVGADIHVTGGKSKIFVAVASKALATRATFDDAHGVVVTVARAFVALAGGRTPAPRRMRALVAEIGADAVFAAGGLAADAAWRLATPRRAIGRIGGAFGLGLPFGAFDGRALADLADRHGDGTIRLTPWRAVVLTTVRDPAALAADAAARGLIVQDDDPRRRLVACPGAPACASATVATRGIATADGPGIVHVSGCAKGCAHPGPAAVTLVGRAGRYELVRDGRAGDAPVASFPTLSEAMAAA